MKEDSNKSLVSSSVRAIVGAEVLIVDRDLSVREGVASLAAEAKMNATAVGDPAEAWELFQGRSFSVAVVDLDTPHPNAGIETVSTIKMISKSTAIIVLSPRKSYEASMEAVRAGAFDVIYKSPDSIPYLKSQLIHAGARSQRSRQVQATLGQTSRTHEQFLQLLMASEREIVDLGDKLAKRSVEDTVGTLRLLIVDASSDFPKALKELAPQGFSIEHAMTGGEALDRAGGTKFHMVMVAENLPDLPQSMVVRSMNAQHSEILSMVYRGPGTGGVIDFADSASSVPVVSQFLEANDFASRLPDLGEAFWAKEKQRRYTQAFREKHYDFVRKFISLKEKLDDVSESGPSSDTH